ncbi:MAG: SseB family protein [Deltaproteobacteria bacterium]|nr:SseB family protein [Deltaproteobacteria bacterium]
MVQLVNLLEILKDACNGDAQAERKFYELIWEIELFIPLQLSGSEQIVQSSAGEKYLSVEHEGRRIIPIFTSLDYLKEWAGHDEFALSKRLFKSFIQLVAEGSWIHLNPAQEYGKDFSPWEISLLKQSGLDALNEILNETSNVCSEVEIEDHTDLFVKLKDKLRAVFEVYPEISEGFAIKMSSLDHPQGIPVIAIKQTGMSADKLKVLVEEIESMCVYDENVGVMPTVVSDLANDTCPHRQLFANSCPFYLLPEEFKRSKVKSWVNK